MVVYDLFKPEEAVQAIRQQVASTYPMDLAAWSATRLAGGTVRLMGATPYGIPAAVLATVRVLTRFNRSNTCPQCDGRCLWTAFDTRSAQWPSIGAEAVGCDECGWIASDHPVAGRPSTAALGDEVEIAGAGS